MNDKPKHIQRKCKRHGLTKYVLEGRGYYRCNLCRSRGVSKRRRKVKILAVASKGGKCQMCGYDKCIDSFDFHHEGEKDFGIASNGKTMSWEKVKKEIEKCLLLCANCHREIHAASKSTDYLL